MLDACMVFIVVIMENLVLNSIAKFGQKFWNKFSDLQYTNMDNLLSKFTFNQIKHSQMIRFRLIKHRFIR